MSGPGTPASAFDGLLDGLDAGDFDDMDFDESPRAKLSRPRSPSAEADEHYDPPAPLPAEIPAMVSFATGRGKALAPPSEAAMSKALKIVREAERELELEEAGPSKRRKHDSPAPAPPVALPSDTPTALPVLVELPPSSFPAPAATPAPRMTQPSQPLFPDSPLVHRTTGFQLGTGRSAAPLPAGARAKALALFGEENESPASDTPGAGPSQARAKVLALFGEDATVAGPSSLATPASGFQLGSGRPAAKPKPQSMARALAIFNDIDDAMPEAVSPAVATQPPAFVPPRPAAGVRRPAGMSTPSRTPLRPLQTGANVSHSLATPVNPKLPKKIAIYTPGGTPRRIGLGATPGSRGKANKGFSTPFKRATGDAVAQRTPSNLRTGAVKPRAPVKIYHSVFDITPPPDRKNMRDAYLHPGFYSISELEEFGLPTEIWMLDLENALYYQFLSDDSKVLDNKVALEHLKAARCDLATAKWVDNHWSLILWKLAGQIRAQPKLFNEKWNWHELMSQLKYRYEREYGAAQRPIVRRILEHDSSPSLPMVLCVSRIHSPPPPEEKDEQPQRPYLDLTDGWYHIRATVDECLARAISKRRIRVGRKLATSGAKLQSGQDGVDALDNDGSSHLMLSGNSTHLAKWDVKLGVQPHPFVAGMSSLSVDGGVIVLMDVIVERLFPLAFMNADRGSREAPWNAEEEAVRADAWKEKYEAERTRLHEEMRKSLEKIEEIASILASQAEEMAPVSSTPPDSVDDDFDTLVESKNVMSAVRALPAARIFHLALHARSRLSAAVEEERGELEVHLNEVCPPRDVRDFRMVRLRDAREGMKGQMRTGMLNVWDARALGDQLVEGRRYLVSNLIPGRAGDWSPPKPGSMREVYLHTRRDTRWKSIE